MGFLISRHTPLFLAVGGVAFNNLLTIARGVPDCSPQWGAMLAGESDSQTISKRKRCLGYAHQYQPIGAGLLGS